MVRRSAAVPIAITLAVVGVLATGGYMVWRAESRTNKVSLSDAPKPVTVLRAKAADYRGSRTYVGTLEPLNAASIGPQLVSAYVDTVLVRPGTVVKHGDVLATLDCHSSGAAEQAVAMQARSIDARQRALAHQSARVAQLLDGGFVSTNEAEQQEALSESEQAQLLATRAKLLGTSLEVNDCILRAPFDGEIATRTIDPGAFVRPGSAIVSIVDRNVVRFTADAPEIDFGVISAGTPVTVKVLSTGRELPATISRRAPSADSATRTMHFEVDIADPTREIPVYTTGEVRIEVGEPVPAAQIPLSSAAIRNGKALVYVIEGDVAHTRTVDVKGEIGGNLYLDPTGLPPGTLVVTEGRALLEDGDKVDAKEAGK